jgi:endonuclease/exonuclease/phosphatase (EEP) superfamily protein YafD
MHRPAIRVRRLERTHLGADRHALAGGARALALLPIALTLLPLCRTGKGWVRIWDFPRVQIAALGLVAYASMIRWSRRQPADHALMAGLTGAVLYQASKILPFTPFYPRQVPPASNRRGPRSIRLLMLNVLQTNRRSDLVRRAVAEAAADVLCLVETNAWWSREMEPLRRDYRWSHECVLENMYGMLLYSRLPIVECTTRFRVEPDIPSMRAVIRLRSGEEVVVYAVHPRPPLPDTHSYGRDAELVLTGAEVARGNGPAVVMGDLNDVAWSYTTQLFQRTAKMLDPRVGRGMFNTFHAEHWLARYPLDHVFQTRHFSLAEIRRLRYTGSDHFPILVELELTPSRKPDMPRPTLSEADRSNIDDIMDGARHIEG